MIYIGIHSYDRLLRYELREEILTLYIAHFNGDLDFDLQPGHGPSDPKSWKQSKPYRVPMVQI